MTDISKVCALCGFYDETAMECERFPPAVKEDYVNDDGDKCVLWYQPFIEHPWTTRCGEWQPINDPLDAPDTEVGKDAMARLQLIVAAHKAENEKKENNVDRN